MRTTDRGPIPRYPPTLFSRGMAKTALVTGVTGQDGSYLAELLLSKGYTVYGLVRRLSSPNVANIRPFMDRIHLLDGDMTDQTSMITALKESRPDEIYNLAAQSFVATSFRQPVLTADVDGLGVVRLLEAAKENAPKARIYQASTSELFGLVKETPQNENTPFHPRSPYGVSKLFAYWACVNYREAYGMHVSNGILFNHECISAETPMIVRDDTGLMDCLPISDIVRDPAHVRQRPMDLDVWDRGAFTRAKLATARWNSASNDFGVHRVVSRSGEVRTTAEHQLILENGRDRTTSRTLQGDRLLRTALPDPPARTSITEKWAELLGLLAAEGCLSYSEGKYNGSLRNNDRSLLNRVQALWEACAGGWVSDSPGVSGFTGEPTGGLRLNAERGMLHYLWDILYTADRHKRVPRVVLNADAAAWRAFLSGYNAGDGLKAGYGDREFKNFKTASPPLAAGLWWMASRTLDQKPTLNIDFVRRGPFGEREYAYYSINLGVEGGPKKGRHLLKPLGEVKTIVSEPYTGWLYDIETASGTFHAGVGDLVVHNSPRRGLEFVTRKITHGVAMIAKGKAKSLELGNLDAKRDWGYAPEYVDAMWQIVQQSKPDDFVIGTGKSHTVREFVELAFREAGIEKWKSHVRTDPKHLRPAEVYTLCADASKAKRVLGWEAKTRLPELVKIMVKADLERVGA